VKHRDEQAICRFGPILYTIEAASINRSVKIEGREDVGADPCDIFYTSCF